MPAADSLGLARRRPWVGAVRWGIEAPKLLLLALGVVCLYAAFAHGGISPAATERLQLGLAAIAAITSVAWVAGGGLTLRAPAAAWAGLALLLAYAAWSGVSLAWSVAPDGTWTEVNRALTYALALVLAIAAGSSSPRSLELTTRGLLAVTLLAGLYALGQKLLPGIRLGGLINLNQTAQLPRLQEPFGYWNALGLFVAFAVPLLLVVAADAGRAQAWRLAASGATVLALTVIAFTYSRGALLALALGLAIGISVSGARLRLLLWLALTVTAAAPGLALGLTSHALTAQNVPLGDRELAGVELAGVLTACVCLLTLAGGHVIARGRSMQLSPSRVRRIGLTLSQLAVAAVVAAILALTLSSRGLPGTVTHVWRSFTTTRAVAVNDPARLLSADSENRWVWWQEAARAFADRPLTGWGAGSFGVVHLRYRHDTLSVQQPHSVPLQLLSETGIVGAALAVGAFVALLAGAHRAVRRRGSDRERLLAAGLYTATVVYAVHALYDWDWNIPGVTLPALMALGVLGGSAVPGRAPGAVALGRAPRWRAAAAAAGCAACLGAFAVSVVTPRLAAARTNQALVAAASPAPGGLREALSQALLAARLDPVSDGGLLAAATIEDHLGQGRGARRYLLSAITREPADTVAWERLAFQDIILGDRVDARIAAGQALALDPRAPGARQLAAELG